MRPTLRGAAALLAAPTLALSALVAISTPASAADDPGPADAAGSWLTGQVDDGLVLSPYDDPEGNAYPDHGLSIDVALAMDAIGAGDAVIDAVSGAIAADLPAYVGADGEEYAGATAKAAVLAQIAGDDPTAFGGVNLVERLEGLVVADGAAAGRIQDTTAYDDYSNSLGQAFAAWALDGAGSALTDPVTDFLLAQQCEEGFIRQALPSVDDPDQTCDAGNGEPDVDSTATTVQALQSQLDDDDVAAHVADAVAWLKGVQNPDGSFGADASIPAANANSTGVAGSALVLAGETEAAASAAAWLRAHQATNVGDACVFYDTSDLGAVAYDEAALTAARGGMDDELRYQSVRATAQAVPALVAAQEGMGDPRAIFTAEYVKAGGKKPVGVGNAAPGEALCAMGGKQPVLGYADVDGDADLRVKVPSKTGTTVVDVAHAGGTFDTVEINALAKTKLKVGVAKQKVKKGKQQTVTVKGLAPGETVTVQLGKKTKNGRASRKGVFTAKLEVTTKPGKRAAKATGQFGNRAGKQTFRVTK